MTKKSTETFRTATTKDGIAVHVCRTGRFKTITLQLWLGKELDEQATYASLLSSVLKQGCKAYPDRRAMGVELEKMYGSAFGCSVGKVGGRQVLTMRMDLPDQRYLPRRMDMLAGGIRFLSEFATRPIGDNGRFVPGTVAREKRNLAAMILSLLDEKMAYAQRRCLEEMCRRERLRFYEYGDITTLDKITPESLYRFYAEFVASAPIDVFVVGDVSLKDAVGLVEKHLVFKRGGGAGFLPVEKFAVPKRPRKVTERQDVEQARLCLGLRTRIGIADKAYAAATVFNGVLGAYSHSRLFKNIREREGLAYQVDSSLEGSRGLMMISMGIDAASYRKALDIVKHQMREIGEGKITRAEMQKTKKRIASQLAGIPDSPPRLISFFYNQSINNGSTDLAEWLRRIAGVKASDVAAVARKTGIDTIYFLRPEKGK